MAAAEFDELNLETQLKEAMDEPYWLGPDDKARIKTYKKVCGELNIKGYQYDPKKWRYAAVAKRDVEFDDFDRYWADDDFLESDWYKFQSAVINHKKYALDKFMNLYEQAGIVGIRLI